MSSPLPLSPVGGESARGYPTPINTDEALGLREVLSPRQPSRPLRVLTAEALHAASQATPWFLGSPAVDDASFLEIISTVFKFLSPADLYQFRRCPLVPASVRARDGDWPRVT